MSTCDTTGSGKAIGDTTGKNGNGAAGPASKAPREPSQGPGPRQDTPRPFAADKIFAHADRVAEWLATGVSRPVTYELDMTNVCGHKCPECFGFNPGRDTAHMSVDEAKAIVRQVADFGGRGLTFTGGGDPLANPATSEVVAYAAGLGLDLGFITNGQALTQEIADLILTHCVWTRISVDAATPEVFMRTHGMDARQFERVLDNVRMLVRRKGELGSGTTVGIGFLTSPETKGDVYGFARLGKSLGVDYAQYRPLLKIMDKPEVDYTDAGVLDDMLRAQKDFSGGSYRVVCSEHKYRLIAEGSVGRDYKKCYGQNFAAVIAADRKMYVCCHMRGVKKYALGDLATDTLPELWNSAARKQTAESVDFADCPPLCRCDSFNSILWDLKDGGAPLDGAGRGREWQHKNFI